MNYIDFQTNALGLNLLEDIFSKAIHDMPPEKGPSTYCKFVQLDEWTKFVPDKDDTSNMCCNWTEVIMQIA